MLENDKTHRGSTGSVVEAFLANLTKAAQACASEKESKEKDQKGASGAAQDALSDEGGNSEEEEPDETNAATHSGLLDQSQSNREGKLEQNSSQVAPVPGHGEDNERDLFDADVDRDFVDTVSFSARNERNGRKKRKDHRNASRYIDEIATSLEDCPATKDPPVYNHYPAGYDTAEGKVVSDIRIDNPQADEIVADPVEPDCAVADHRVPSAPPFAGSDAKILEESIAVDDGYSTIPATEEPPPVPAVEEQVEAGSEGPPSVSCPPAPAVLVEASSAQTEDTKKYAVVLKIPHGSEVLMTMVCLGPATNAALLNEAEEIYAERVSQYEPEEKGWERECTRRLLTVTMGGHEVDISAFVSEDLTFLVERISKSGIPIFAVEIYGRRIWVG